ncbi:alpha-D-ribose 1-methylphosphonate 5-triphosphate synthase subunit PhnL [Rhizobium sp. BK313]|uniref:hypothetical protein n=1 Tax=Rhizobium sp. BK313 TaxID=2587081 RepID=UPI001414F782|nr:hypothetical protein [Rhizobium sp. BK313]MBB3452655.1 alpha-D-ribose 1-methylphosphonate 5-triphosphate synthase subunit PhnL [Rhizobium sp. BK313]
MTTDATLVAKKKFEELGHVSQLLRILTSLVALLVVDRALARASSASWASG